MRVFAERNTAGAVHLEKLSDLRDDLNAMEHKMASAERTVHQKVVKMSKEVEQRFATALKEKEVKTADQMKLLQDQLHILIAAQEKAFTHQEQLQQVIEAQRKAQLTQDFNR
jgi:oligoendopeptidase F